VKHDPLSFGETLGGDRQVRHTGHIDEPHPGQIHMQHVRAGNRVCPFAEKVVGRESMCMMTSNVFGTIAARNLGYARVELEETIARGDAGCRVVVHLVPDVDVETVSGREYFGDQAVAP